MTHKSELSLGKFWHFLIIQRILAKKIFTYKKSVAPVSASSKKSIKFRVLTPNTVKDCNFQEKQEERRVETTAVRLTSNCPSVLQGRRVHSNVLPLVTSHFGADLRVNWILINMKPPQGLSGYTAKPMMIGISVDIGSAEADPGFGKQPLVWG